MLDNIKWGNPTREVLPLLRNISPLDKFFAVASHMQYPSNTSKGCREELNILVDYTSAAFKDKDYYENLKFYALPINQLFEQIVEIEGLQALNENVLDTIDCIIEDTIPLIIKLKYHYQRPRPNQLAVLFKMGMFPYATVVDSPSFPSGYAVQARLLCHVLGNMFPDRLSYFDSLGYEISQSRIYMGVNYPSDVDAGLMVADIIKEDNEFQQRHGLKI